MNKVIGLVVGVLVIFGVVYCQSPSFRAMFDSKVGELKEWTPEARRNDPVGYIDYSLNRLQKNIDKFDVMKGELETSKRGLEKLVVKNENLRDMGEKRLGEFKAAYKAATASGSWPVEIVGQKYKEAELKSQVAMILGQRDAANASLEQLKPAVLNIANRINDVVARSSDSRAKLGILQSQRETVKALKLTKEFEQTLQNVQDILV